MNAIREDRESSVFRCGFVLIGGHVKRLLFLSICSITVVASALTVTDVVAKPRYPWNGKVDISFTLDCTNTTEQLRVYIVAHDIGGGTNLPVRTLLVGGEVADIVRLHAGRHTVTWDADVDAPGVLVSNLVCSVVSQPEKLYMIVDLSGGASATNYPVSYLADAPADGWSDEYKTTKLVLRWVEPGKFKMGSPSSEVGRNDDETQHLVTLSTGFWVGIFEVTQQQFMLVTGSNPSRYGGETHPVENVPYIMVRGSLTGEGWPNAPLVDNQSFVGKLRMKTGRAFDLPTEAQWEYACRAGTETALNNGKNLQSSYLQDASLTEVGHYDDTQHTSVGSLRPNDWGLYDMHGNIGEFCLDWYGDYSSSSMIDPEGVDIGLRRVVRGGNYRSWNASDCRSASRGSCEQELADAECGFRICCSAAEVGLSPRKSGVVLLNAEGSDTPRQQSSTACGRAIGDLPLVSRTGYLCTGWFTAADGGKKVSATTIVKGDLSLYARWTALTKPKTVWMAIDLSGGPSVSRYPVSYPTTVVLEDYKATKLLFRYIAPGTFMMGDSKLESDGARHRVTITKGFWIGVFEVTQRQWELVMGTRPSYFKNDSCYATRPVDSVSYEMIRGLSLGTKWPESSAVDADSFLGRLRVKTGGAFDLPTEAQWEYACRAGTTTQLNSGYDLSNTDRCGRLDRVARYSYNNPWQDYDTWRDLKDVSTSVGTAKVGAYIPNEWGLYDMHGNVTEWCLDWYGAYSSSSQTDPRGAISGSHRVARGGCCGCWAFDCTSSYRHHYYPSYTWANLTEYDWIGFRLCIIEGPSN